MVLITPQSGPEGDASHVETTPPTATRATTDDESPPLLCWICRQPLREDASVYWRGEPIHPDCR